MKTKIKKDKLTEKDLEPENVKFRISIWMSEDILSLWGFFSTETIMGNVHALIGVLN